MAKTTSTKTNNTLSLKPLFISWLPLAVTITLLCGLIYTVAQQNLRQSANDPQVQIIADAASQLATGQPPDILNQQPKVDMQESLSAFMAVYDDKGKLLASDAYLDNKTPNLPPGVFSTARNKEDYRFTWQPKPGVRSAVVLRHFSGKGNGFIAVGRSLKEIEKMEQHTLQLVAAGWLATLLLSFAAMYLKHRLMANNK